MDVSTDHLRAARRVASILGHAVKSLDGAIADYRDAIGELIQNLLRGGASHFGNKADFRREFKAEIKSSAKDVFEEAWTEGGGDVAETEADDIELMQEFVSEQQSHVDDFSDWLVSKDTDLDEAQGRLNLWEQSMTNFGERVKLRAQGDPMVTLDGDDGKESCDECQEYKGQWHRLSWWERRDLTTRNGNANYGCGRWENCQHGFYNKAGDLMIA